MKRIFCECCDEPILYGEEHIKFDNVYMHKSCFDDNNIDFIMNVMDVDKYELFEAKFDVARGTFEEELSDEDYKELREKI